MGAFKLSTWSWSRQAAFVWNNKGFVRPCLASGLRLDCSDGCHLGCFGGVSSLNLACSGWAAVVPLQCLCLSNDTSVCCLGSGPVCQLKRRNERQTGCTMRQRVRSRFCLWFCRETLTLSSLVIYGRSNSAGAETVTVLLSRSLGNYLLPSG